MAMLSGVLGSEGSSTMSTFSPRNSLVNTEFQIRFQQTPDQAILFIFYFLIYYFSLPLSSPLGPWGAWSSG